MPQQVISKGKVVCTGGKASIHGIARLIRSVTELEAVQQGDILVCEMTAPDWMPAFDRVGAVICATGGPLSHAALVARGRNLPCIVAATGALDHIPDGEAITLMLPSPGAEGQIMVGEMDTQQRHDTWHETAERVKYGSGMTLAERAYYS